mmetsp:Transcript_23204/g.73062  ORF Transcript_23204/g.73062 Transcript_23204/m.73062 type:complete len:281 (-) Transcript_23204:106-948(-)
MGQWSALSTSGCTRAGCIKYVPTSVMKANLALSLLRARCGGGRGDALPAHDAWALVLDAPSLATSRSLARLAGFRPERIVVPNDSDAAFGPSAAAHATVLQGVTLHGFLSGEGAVGTREREGAAPPRFSCVFCDFTCCLDGSWRPAQELEAPAARCGTGGGAALGTSPTEDLEALFGRGRLEPSGAVLAVTLSHLRSGDPGRRPHASRSGAGGSGRGSGAGQWERLHTLLGLLALRQGLCAVPLPPRIEQTAVATEFWLVGLPHDARFRCAVEGECRSWV